MLLYYDLIWETIKQNLENISIKIECSNLDIIMPEGTVNKAHKLTTIISTNKHIEIGKLVTSEKTFVKGGGTHPGKRVNMRGNE